MFSCPRAYRIRSISLRCVMVLRSILSSRARLSTLEKDFFIRNTDSLIPVEVKARSGRAKSMRTLIESDKYPDISFGFKFTYNNIGYGDRVFTFPYFCIFLLKRFMKTFEPSKFIAEDENYD